MTFGIECVLRYKCFAQAADLWSRIAATHPALADQHVYLYDEGRIRFADVQASMQQKPMDDFSVEFASGEIFFAQVANHRLARLEFAGVVNSVADADSWLSALLHEPDFIQARIYAQDYDHWQNATNPIVYESAGRSISGLKLISNGLSYPLAGQAIDISGNPGRSILRSGYIESVGSVMWLGNGFWDALGRPAPDCVEHARASR